MKRRLAKWLRYCSICHGIFGTHYLYLHRRHKLDERLDAALHAQAERIDAGLELARRYLIAGAATQRLFNDEYKVIENDV